ncbi:ferredoxin [Kaistia soli DSM 19436]|uniref:Ferredoxin n=1 Tax=Kaistia soli DSM 19436 TaxID=1122133 RepID=A0A1M5DZS2_9HYPH|nr:ferredoxin family protein [Kaistia soli]SHF72374.1 ferredoxin [Kaistia soli DSM 19436]
MPHVVTENCTDCQFTDCVEVCPVSCFHGDGRRVYIDPVACIDCGACVPLCPVHAIYEDLDLTEERESWQELNAVRAPALPVVRKKQAPLAGAEARKASLGYS